MLGITLLRSKPEDKLVYCMCMYRAEPSSGHKLLNMHNKRGGESEGTELKQNNTVLRLKSNCSTEGNRVLFACVLQRPDGSGLVGRDGTTVG